MTNYYIVSSYDRVHRKGNFFATGDPMRGIPSQIWTACNSRLIDPEYIDNRVASLLGRKMCKRCFPKGMTDA